MTSEWGIIILNKNEQRSHNEKYHATTTLRKSEPLYSNVTKILPDQDFLTNNTADLEAMLD